MNVLPLAIVQARMGSTRLPGKMFLPLAGRPLIWHAWRRAVEAFGMENVVVATPDTAENAVLRSFIEQEGGMVYAHPGDEDDVLSRFWHCAHVFRWHPDTVIVRITPDDPLKDPALLRLTAQGCRYQPEIGGEATTLGMLDYLHVSVTDTMQREHIGYLLNPTPLPPMPGMTVDTQEDYDAMRALMEGES